MNLSSIALTPVIRNGPPPSTSSSVSAKIIFNVAIPIAALRDLSGYTSFTFLLSCQPDSSNEKSFAKISIPVNSSPAPGQFSIMPSSGVELSTVFYFTATYWDDVDIPLSYEFGYSNKLLISSDGTEKRAVSLLRTRSDNKDYASVLPAPSAGIDSVVVYLSIYDYKDAFVTVESEVDVVATEINFSLLQTYSDTIQTLASTSSALQVAVMVTDSMTKVYTDCDVFAWPQTHHNLLPPFLYFALP